MFKVLLIISIVGNLVIVSGKDEQRNDDSSSSLDSIPIDSESKSMTTKPSKNSDTSSSGPDDDSASSTSSNEKNLNTKTIQIRRLRPIHLCGPNEVYSTCLNAGCDRRNCSQLGSPKICIDVLPAYCKKGCQCRENYLRDENGICIPTTDCPTPKCGRNEVFDFCPAPCPPRRCDVDERLIKCASPPKIGDKECNPGCRCADNYYRNQEELCVPKSQCVKCRGKDEVYEECPKTCPPQTCQSIWAKYNCPIQPAVCTPSCRCKPNMFRNTKGECISKQDCLMCRGQNEYFSCGGACDNECDKLSRQNQTSCPIINITCNRKCYCAPGYARNVDNVCIPFSQCPPECKVNEEYVKNVKGIRRPRTCSEFVLGIMEYQKENSTTVPGCVCVEGYARDRNGLCIPSNKCYADEGVKDVGDTNDTDIIVISAIKYVRPTCGANEIMGCINYACEKQNCSQLGLRFVCRFVLPKDCKKVCRCKENYLRDKNGICIPISDCPAPTCPGKDEEYVECPRTCPPQTCESLTAKFKCAPTTTVCKPACQCKPNMYRNKRGECITKEQCSRCKANEYYANNVNANSEPKTCAELVDPPIRFQHPRSPMKNKPTPSEPGCVCFDNYYRNDRGVCVPAKDCPQCKRNEVYVNNTSAVCRAQKCSQLGYPLDCEEFDKFHTDNGKPGCICKEGYVRDENGVCINAEYCPSCGGDLNAVKGCGVFCETCDTYKNGPKRCPRICFQNGCQCKKNHVYDSKISKCVLPEECDDSSQEIFYL